MDEVYLGMAHRAAECPANIMQKPYLHMLNESSSQVNPSILMVMEYHMGFSSTVVDER